MTLTEVSILRPLVITDSAGSSSGIAFLSGYSEIDQDAEVENTPLCLANYLHRKIGSTPTLCFTTNAHRLLRKLPIHCFRHSAIGHRWK